MITANGVDLCVQTFGHVADPTVLLISGAASTMEIWPEPFCRELAARDRHVVRYDLRDAGESVTYPPGQPPYTVLDLADDAVALLDGLDVDRADVVGLSMGGAIGQLMALRHPDRVSALTLVASFLSLPSEHKYDLPGMSEEVATELVAVLQPNWDDAESVLDYLVESERRVAARSAPFDEEGMRATMRTVVARSRDVRALTNHFDQPEADVTGLRARDIEVPTVVVHGDEDPLRPLPHGEALAAEIPGARLVVLPGVGHEVPERAWPTLLETIVRSC